MSEKKQRKILFQLSKISPEAKQLYLDGLRIVISDFEAGSNLLAHTARNIVDVLSTIIEERRDSIDPEILKEFEAAKNRKDDDGLAKLAHRHGEAHLPPRPMERIILGWNRYEDALYKFLVADPDSPLFSEAINPISVIDPITIMNSDQVGIHDGLKAMGAQVSAFFRDIIRLQNSDLYARNSFLLAHLCREIEGSINGVFSDSKEKKKIEKHLKKQRKEDLSLSHFKGKEGHLATLITTLNVEFDNSFLNTWGATSSEFAKYVHASIERPLNPEIEQETIALWGEYQKILSVLVGKYIHVLERLDRLLDYDQPNEFNNQKGIHALLSLLKYPNIRGYFFSRLTKLKWLPVLYEHGFFSPENNPTPEEVPGELGQYTIGHWAALDYLQTVFISNKGSIEVEYLEIANKVLKEILSAIDQAGSVSENYRTDRLMIRIMSCFPEDSMDIAFVHSFRLFRDNRFEQFGSVLAVRNHLLPHLALFESKRFYLELVKILLEPKALLKEMQAQHPLAARFDAYYDGFDRAIGDIVNSIPLNLTKEVLEIALNTVEEVLSIDSAALMPIEVISFEKSPQTLLPERYSNQLAFFINILIERSRPEDLVPLVNSLILREEIAFHRIAFRMIDVHYQNLGHFFWACPQNPLYSSLTKREVYSLLENHGCLFTDIEIETFHSWVEAFEFIGEEKLDLEYTYYLRKEWLFSLNRINNDFINSRIEYYHTLNDCKIQHPGWLTWSESQTRHISPLSLGELKALISNDLVLYLNAYTAFEPVPIGEPSRDGLLDMFAELAANKFEWLLENLMVLSQLQNDYLERIFMVLGSRTDQLRGRWEQVSLFFLATISQPTQEGAARIQQGALGWLARVIEKGANNNSIQTTVLKEVTEVLSQLICKVEHRNLVSPDILTAVLNDTAGRVWSACFAFMLYLKRNTNTIKYQKRIERDLNTIVNKHGKTNCLAVVLGQYLPYLHNDFRLWSEKFVKNGIRTTTQLQIAQSYLSYFPRPHLSVYQFFRRIGIYSRILDQVEFKSKKNMCIHVITGFVESGDVRNSSFKILKSIISSGGDQWREAIITAIIQMGGYLRNKDQKLVKKTWKCLNEYLKGSPLLGRTITLLGAVRKVDSDIEEWILQALGYANTEYAGRWINQLYYFVTQYPNEVANFYLKMIEVNFMPTFPEDRIIYIIAGLYEHGEQVIADKICNSYAERGDLFLIDTYKIHRILE